MSNTNNLTANARAKKLRDKYLQFMSTNNPDGFVDDPDVEVDDSDVAGILINVSRASHITYAEIKEKAATIRTMTNKAIKLGQALHYLALAMGYYTYKGALTEMKDDIIINKRKSASLANEQLFRPEQKKVRVRGDLKR